MVVLEKISKYNHLGLIEKLYVKCEFEKASALVIIAAFYNALTLLTQAAQLWENKNLAAWFAGKDAFFSLLSIIYIALGLIFIFMGLEIVGAITLVAAGHTSISFLHHNAPTWQNTSLAAWFVSQHA